MFSGMEGLSCFTTTTPTTNDHHLYQMEERDNSSDNSGDNSPSSTAFAISSPKRSRRAIQKRVVTVPIKDLEGSRFKGDCTPPSDSWAWRKYGQKPIKGSPYPRGYYRCSSSKGCPARKQVERSRADPSTLVITYSYEHNHPWPLSRSRHNSTATAAATSNASTTTFASTATTTNTNTNLATTAATIPAPIPKLETTTSAIATTNHHNHQLGLAHVEPLMVPTDELTWLTSDPDSNSFFSGCGFGDFDMAKIFPLGEEEDAFFADLGELPECSIVFGQPTGGPAAKREKEDIQQQQQQPQQCSFNWS